MFNHLLFQAGQPWGKNKIYWSLKDDSFSMTEIESVQSKTLVPESSEYETEYGTESANESVSVMGLNKVKK